MDLFRKIYRDLPLSFTADWGTEKKYIHGEKDMTPAKLVYDSGICANDSLLVAGSMGKAVPFLKQMMYRSREDTVLILPDSKKGSPVCALAGWESDRLAGNLPDGNGILYVPSGSIRSLAMELSHTVGALRTKNIMIYAGSGLMINAEIFHTLLSLSHVTILMENVQQGIASGDSAFNAMDVVRSMDYILFAGYGNMAGIEDLLPKYQVNKVSGHIDFSSFDRNELRAMKHPHPGKGFSLGQGFHKEASPVVSAEDLMKLSQTGDLLLYDCRTGHSYRTDRD